MLRRPPTTLTLTAEDIANFEDGRAQRQAQLQQLQSEEQHARALAMAQAQAQAQPQLQARHQATRPRLRQQNAPLRQPSSPNESMDEPMEDAAGACHDNEEGGEEDQDDDEEEEEDGEEEEEEEEEEEDDDDDDDEDDDPFTQRRLQRAAMGHGRAVSPGAQRSAYLQQMRARGGRHGRSQSHTQAQVQAHTTSIPTSTSTYHNSVGPGATASRAQRITGTVSASALPPAAQMPPSHHQQHHHLQQTPVQNITAAHGGTSVMTRSGAGRGRQTSEPPPAPARVTRSRDERIGLAPGVRPVDMGGPGGGGGGAAGPTRRR